MANIQEKKEKTLDVVEDKVSELKEEGEVDFPVNFSARNALKSAWLEIQGTKDKDDNYVLDSCSTRSIQNALLDTVVQGLNPAKEQVYYIAYGRSLVAQRSYFGDIYLAKQAAGVDRVNANVIYEGDTLSLKTKDGRQVVTNHEQSFENMDDDQVAGAYAIVKFKDDRPDEHTIMKRAQLEAAWERGNWSKSKDSDPHNAFTGEMAKKTVIHRALKPLINSSDDSHLFAAAKNRAPVAQAKQERETEKQEQEMETIDAETVGGNGDTKETNEKEQPEEENSQGKHDGSGGQGKLIDDEQPENRPERGF